MHERKTMIVSLLRELAVNRKTWSEYCADSIKYVEIWLDYNDVYCVTIVQNALKQ